MRLDGAQRWLLLVHQLPSKPSNLRVKTWRRLQSVGAVLIKNSVYVLPNTRETVEDLHWIRGEILARGGEATVFAADAIDDLSTDEIKEAFTAARQSDWEELLARATALQESLDGTSPPSRAEIARELDTLRNRAAQIDKIDYFQAPGREAVLRAIEGTAQRLEPESASPPTERPTYSPQDFVGRRWLTRPRPGVDRMASAWLIVRFVDADAEFLFADSIPGGEDVVPFDMFGVEFGHHGDRCTFETLLALFGLDDPALARIARIVHDLDLRSESTTDTETTTIGRLIYGLREAVAEDETLLDRGIVVFEALYRSFRSEAAPA